MIIADVFVPSIDKTYNFSLDENAKVSSLIDELIAMVSQRENAPFAGSPNAVVLICKQSQQTLPKENTLKECAVATGSTLILI